MAALKGEKMLTELAQQVEGAAGIFAILRFAGNPKIGLDTRCLTDSIMVHDSIWIFDQSGGL